jgi:hypothetical protein
LTIDGTDFFNSANLLPLTFAYSILEFKKMYHMKIRIISERRDDSGGFVPFSGQMRCFSGNSSPFSGHVRCFSGDSALLSGGFALF